MFSLIPWVNEAGLRPVLTRLAEIGFENIEPYGSNFNGYTAEEFRAMVDTLGLRDRLSHRPSEMSGGEQQRVAIARAVIARPEILVADEPTGNVDPDMALKLLRLFEALNRLGTTVVVATHDVHLLKKVPDSLIMRLDRGRLSDPTGALRYPPRREVAAQ